MSFWRKLLYAIPLLLATSLWVVDPILGRLLLPFREVLLVLTLVQLVICMAVIARSRVAPKAYLWAVAVCGVALMGVVMAQEYDTSERTIAFDSNGTRLVGTLYRPRAAGMRPSLVVVHGSGKFPRRMYRYWGQKFARLGFNVLVYDKRGVGDSGGVYEGENNTSDENLQILATDAANAVNVVAGLPDTTQHIGLFGISQGGWIAPLAAQLNPKVKFLVIHSGPVVSVRQQNLYSRWTGEGHGSGTMTIGEAEQRLSSSQPGGVDPRRVLAELDVRALWLFGDNDKLVPVQTSVENLQTLIGRGKRFEYEMFPAADHLILTRETRFSSRLSKQYWSAIVNWMEQNKDRQLADATGR